MAIKRQIFHKNRNNFIVKCLSLTLISLMFTTYQNKIHLIASVNDRIYKWGEIIRYAAYTPIDAYIIGKNYLLEKTILINDIKDLNVENLRLKQLLTHYSMQESEKAAQINLNIRMANKKDLSYTVAKITSINTNITHHEITLSVGVDHNVKIGDTVFDGKSIIGHIIEVSKYQSRVMLLTDSRCAIPSLIKKHGYHAILLGLGGRELELIDVADTIDVKVGDEIVSSGLGNRFPYSLPIGRVSFVNKIPGEHFTKIYVQAFAKPHQTRHYVIIHKTNQSNEVMYSAVNKK